ncbi:hypothetical protein E4U19_000258 [Claviceps sp. Clav32 group G5]|nr:hypothetical protein E4U40_002551 [Claviceps sp. LM458 group G5]KAG6030815.1 hypothetical protein E4U19_000258 [Claviceps sp. Clav32 group G5]KAG6049588.1 hypothetical protein E4U39_005841 [Claviceps sp. Clav50 group G5]KAG6059591.1 hypothetical protein E4U17_005986 [Claviceps sp. LM77 group G4]KAG6062592.1 hypothetical protein E4U33_006506 [Claviceps sp. LM78 group G4]
MSVAADYRRWLRQKQYTFEVTFALNMFRSWEKSVIYSVLFLLISMTLIAAILYLPHHITLLAGRAWYYIQGDHINIAVSTSEAIKVVSATVAEALPTGETVKEAVARTLEKEL